MKVFEIGIIGGGPAGISSGIQLKRFGYEPIIFEKNKVGGLLRNAYLIENYPGFYNGISGKDLVKRFETHINKMKVKIVHKEVVKIDYENNVYTVKTKDKKYHFKIIIIASGTIPKETNDFGINNETKDRILYEISDLNISNKTLAIIGSGDAAFDYAINLSEKKNKIIIINRSDNAKALDILKNKVAKDNNINYLSNTIVRKVDFKNQELILTLFNKSNKREFIKNVFLLIIAIGRNPNLGFLSKEIINLKEELNKKGILYFTGDVKNGIYRQSSISIGDGIKTAMKIHDKIKKEVKHGNYR